MAFYGSTSIKRTLADLKTWLTTQLGSKTDKVSNATSGNFAGLDANGNLTDSGKNPENFLGKVTTMPANPSLGDVVVYTGADTAEFKKGHTYKAVAGDTFYGLTVEYADPPEARPYYPYDVIYVKALPLVDGHIDNPALYAPDFSAITNVDTTSLYAISAWDRDPGTLYRLMQVVFTYEGTPVGELNFLGYDEDAAGTPKLITVTPVVWQEVIDMGTAAAKNSTSSVTDNSTDLVESGAVYTAINTAIGNAVDNLLDTNF